MLTDIHDPAVRSRALDALAARGVRLPTFAELADPTTIDPAIAAELSGVDPDAPHPRNLFRVHWHNDESRRGLSPVPGHVVLPSVVTGVDAPIVVLFGDRFPMIGAHKVLAAYACLVPRLVTGRFDPVEQRALWPSTGNYCRGGVAISRILGCRGVAILPEEMSAERFEWLGRWVVAPDDIVRTHGSESNVKEIYDACASLSRDPRNVVLNQFRELANHVVHREVTARAVERVHAHLAEGRGSLRLSAFVSATGSAGTLGAGSALAKRHGAKVVAVEALECPTLLANGYGAHHIQGIGDKHVPYIHDVMGTDVVAAVSDRATDALFAVANDPAAAPALDRRGWPAAVRAALRHFGFSSFCNVLAAIKTAKTLGLGSDDALYTVATDGAALYPSELPRIRARLFGGAVDPAKAEAALARHLDGASIDHVRELDHQERLRIFQLGYFTWVEQQGVPLAEFEARKSRTFWDELPSRIPAWDAAIRAFDDELRARAR
ncbi:MAG: pyridoxal-5'-phosphate-dependent protein subunit beta [Verrucomicrobia bacterium]|nr:pyridoxal-5'-phosphate-dependent protein subunit beta [Verrucomicrobiota bacterium]